MIDTAIHHRPRPGRSGALLIVATGLSAMMLGLALAFVMNMRNEAGRSDGLTQDVRCRLMLHAAKCYLLESSRLGWGAQETMGWNDVRTHAIGPIPIDRDPIAANALWSAGTWPAPGSVVRCPIQRLTRPPFAVHPGPRNTFSDPKGQTSIGALDDALFNKHPVERVIYADPEPIVPVGDPSFATGFAAGDRTPVPGSEFQSWFRVYRETASDHDGDGSPFYDVINLNGGDPIEGGAAARPANASVFLVTAGAGASLGFRDWAEVVAAGKTAIFDSAGEFDRIRAAEAIRWYRLEWSPYHNMGSGKGLRANSQHTDINNLVSISGYSSNNGDAFYSVPYPFGHIRWVQRLDQEPPTW